jgi:hypothetical protein
MAAAAAAAAAADVPEQTLPSREDIALAKKRREKARTQQTDFIPLDGREDGRGRNAGARQGTDDADMIGMDDGEMSFGEAARRTQKLSARVRVGAALQDGLDVDDGDEDFTAWEQQQIQSGVKARQRRPPPPPPVPTSQAASSAASERRRRQAVPSALATDGRESALDSVARSLSEALESMTEVHSGHHAHVTRLKDDLALSESLANPLETELASASDRYRFYHETRGCVRGPTHPHAAPFCTH